MVKVLYSFMILCTPKGVEDDRSKIAKYLPYVVRNVRYDIPDRNSRKMRLLPLLCQQGLEHFKKKEVRASAVQEQGIGSKLSESYADVGFYQRY